MTTILFSHADWIITAADCGQRSSITPVAGVRQIQDGAILVRDGWIEAVGPATEVPDRADEVIDAEGMLLFPGLINTHHHLYQTLTRALPAAQNAALFDWLRTLYPIWAHLTSHAVYISAKVGLAELLLSGCTTAVDHLYLYPNDVTLDDEIRAAQEIGIRFVATRGGMSRGESEGGLPPDHIVESEAAILQDMQRVIELYHDDRPGAMLQIALAPCSPFSVTEDLMRESASLARSYGVRLHTHLAETTDEEEYCKATAGMSPIHYAESLGWLGPDVWFAHGVHVSPAEISLLAQTQSGIAHCPSSNMRLGSGIAPVRRYLDEGVRVGLAVDGSASNDSSHMLAEARMALLLQRVGLQRADALTPGEALGLATAGGAALLGRNELGRLEVGMAADFAGVRLDRLAYAGAAVHDPLGALLLCAPQSMDLVVVNGRVVVKEGQLLTVDLPRLVEQHNRLAQSLMSGH